MAEIRDFEGLVAVVTGGASGIGKATADLLERRGATVAVLDLSPAEGRFSVPCDISSAESVDGAIATVIEKYGQIDVLINNAGVGAVGDVAANSDEEWLAKLNTNVVGVARVSRAALPHLKQSDNAVIVNTGSIVSIMGLPERALYTACKGAIWALTMAMAADHLADGIRVNVVCPGTADTPWVGRLLDAADDPVAERAALEARQPHGRLVSPEEVAEAMCYLASPLNRSSTGVSLAVDGGMDRIHPRKV